MSRKSPRYALNKNKYLLPPEVRHLKELLTKHEPQEPMNCLLIKTALLTGARAQETLNLEKADLDAHNETLFIKGLKNSNDREIPVPSDYFESLIKYSKTVEGARVFPISYSRLHVIWDEFRPTPKTFHSLRHTFAIQLYQKTKDLRLVQTALGHRSISNTMIYADYLYSQEELRKLIL